MGMRHGGAEGESPLPPEQSALVVDLVYNPEATPLLEAAARGRASLDGLPMLIYQGAEAFEMWIGRKAPIEVMNDHPHLGAVTGFRSTAVQSPLGACRSDKAIVECPGRYGLRKTS